MQTLSIFFLTICVSSSSAACDQNTFGDCLKDVKRNELSNCGKTIRDALECMEGLDVVSCPTNSPPKVVYNNYKQFCKATSGSNTGCNELQINICLSPLSDEPSAQIQECTDKKREAIKCMKERGVVNCPANSNTTIRHTTYVKLCTVSDCDQLKLANCFANGNDSDLSECNEYKREAIKCMNMNGVQKCAADSQYMKIFIAYRNICPLYDIDCDPIKLENCSTNVDQSNPQCNEAKRDAIKCMKTNMVVKCAADSKYEKIFTSYRKICNLDDIDCDPIKLENCLANVDDPSNPQCNEATQDAIKCMKTNGVGKCPAESKWKTMHENLTESCIIRESGCDQKKLTSLKMLDCPGSELLANVVGTKCTKDQLALAECIRKKIDNDMDVVKSCKGQSSTDNVLKLLSCRPTSAGSRNTLQSVSVFYTASTLCLINFYG